MDRAMAGVVFLAAGMLCGCTTTGTMPAATTMPKAAVPAPAPAGFLSFCMRFAAQCEAAPGAPSIVALNDQTWRTLSSVNRDINDSIWPEEDEAHYGRAEYWTIPTDGYGDCDDYAVTKRKALIDRGFPGPSLRLAVVLDSHAERHAVLTVATDKGDLVLDNQRSDIVSWNNTGFTWIERQDAANPRNWVFIRPAVVTAQASDPPTASAR